MTPETNKLRTNLVAAIHEEEQAVGYTNASANAKIAIRRRRTSLTPPFIGPACR